MRPPRYLMIAGQGVIVVAISALLVDAVLNLPREAGGLTTEARRSLPVSGVEHDVTAVLLNYRAYDTLLEVTILMLAALGLLAMRRVVDFRSLPREARRSPILWGLVLLLVPATLVVASHELWAGSYAPGGAFQAGVLVAAVVVLLRLAGFRSIEAVPANLLRALLFVGLLTILAVAAGTLLTGRDFLEYPPDLASTLIIVIEAMAAIAVGATLGAMFMGTSLPADATDPGRPETGAP